MKSTYTVHSGDILRHGSGDGWIRVDSFNGDTYSVTDVDIITGAVGTASLLTKSDMLRCVKEETGSTYDRVVFVPCGSDSDSVLPTFRPDPDHLDLFGDGVNAESTFTADELDGLSARLGIPVQDLLGHLLPVDFEATVNLMDDDLREDLAASAYGWSESRFLYEYCKAHQKKFGCAFHI